MKTIRKAADDLGDDWQQGQAKVIFRPVESEGLMREQNYKSQASKYK
jgi:hypothetical protein